MEFPIMNPLCKCGCGNRVKTQSAKYIRGHNYKDPEFQKRLKKKNIERYGVDNIFKLESSKEKYKQTMRKKYGVDNPSKIESIKNKKKETCLKNHGVEIPYQSDSIKTKIKNTCQEKYGGIGFSSRTLNDKVTRTLIDHYGVDNYAKTIMFRQLAKQLMIDRLNDQLFNGDTISPCIGKLEPSFFKWLQSHTNYVIIRPLKNMYGCFPDGYIDEINLVIEFDEPYHNQPQYIKRDNVKDEIYKLNNLNIFRVPQKQWEENPDSIKEQFLSLIESIQNSCRLDQ